MKLNFKKAIFLFCILFFVNSNIIAQSNSFKAQKLSKKCTNGDINSCEKLNDMALNHKKQAARYEAVKVITNQNILADIVKKNEEGEWVRVTALEKITNQKFLANIAKNETNKRLRYYAVKNLTDQKVLADILKNDKELDVRKAVRKRISRLKILETVEKQNQKILETVEKQNQNILAIEGITDQNVLADIAKNDKDRFVRWAAFIKITNNDILLDIAKTSTSSNINVREAAVKKISDQNILVDIAKNDNHQLVRRAAIKKISDQNVLVDIAKNDKEYIVRITAINILTGRNDKSIKNITDLNYLADIAKNESNRLIASAAVEKITDQNTLADIARNMRTNYRNIDLHCKVLIRLNEDAFSEQIIEIINLNIKTNPNLAKIGALKIIDKNKYLMNNYKDIKISVSLYSTSKKYSFGVWRTLDYKIEIKSKNIKKAFSYRGKRGGQMAYQRDLNRIHRGTININEICEFLLSPISKEDLLKISTESDVIYLREVANRMLQNKTIN